SPSPSCKSRRCERYASCPWDNTSLSPLESSYYFQHKGFNQPIYALWFGGFSLLPPLTYVLLDLSEYIWRRCNIEREWFVANFAIGSSKHRMDIGREPGQRFRIIPPSLLEQSDLGSSVKDRRDVEDSSER